MFDIDRMVINDDFSVLLNSTQEERDNNGGNLHIYDELTNYIYIDEVRQVIEHTFKDDMGILDNLHHNH